MEYNKDEVIPTPIEKEKERNLQYPATVRAWRSKYGSHIGAKELRKKLTKDIKGMSAENILGLYKHTIINGNCNPRVSETCKEILTDALNALGVEIPQPAEQAND